MRCNKLGKYCLIVFLKEANIKSLLEYFMGKNTPNWQQHIIQNLRVEVDILKEAAVA